MLKANGMHAIEFRFEPLAEAILRLDPDRFRPFDFSVDTWYRKAAFLAGFGTLCSQDFRTIEQYGWGNFLSREVIPGSVKIKNGSGATTVIFPDLSRRWTDCRPTSRAS